MMKMKRIIMKRSLTPKMKRSHFSKKKRSLMPKIKRIPKTKFCTSQPKLEVGKQIPQEGKLMPLECQIIKEHLEVESNKSLGILKGETLSEYLHPIHPCIQERFMVINMHILTMETNL